LRVRPPRGRGNVPRRFACTGGVQGRALRWPLVTGQDCRGSAKGNIFQSLGFSADLTFPARWPPQMLARQSRSSRGHSLSARYRSRLRRIRYALRAVRKQRHPEMPCARSRPGLRPSGGFVAYLAVDHQMTPTLFAELFGPAALPPRSLADRLSGSASRPLRPKAPRRAGLREVVAPVGRRAPVTLFR